MPALVFGGHRMTSQLIVGVLFASLIAPMSFKLGLLTSGGARAQFFSGICCPWIGWMEVDRPYLGVLSPFEPSESYWQRGKERARLAVRQILEKRWRTSSRQRDRTGHCGHSQLAFSRFRLVCCISRGCCCCRRRYMGNRNRNSFVIFAQTHHEFPKRGTRGPAQSHHWECLRE